MRIAFIGIVKDGEEYIRKNIEHVAQLNQDIYIVENNSTDDTKNILLSLKSEGKIKSITTLDIDQRDAMSLCDMNMNLICKERVRRLAYIRQKGLEAVLNSGLPYDYICPVDLDFLLVNLNHFMDTVNFMETNKDVDGIFGMSYAPAELFGISYTFPYDVGAVNPYHKLPLIIFGPRYVRVDSAFSGFGLYRMSSVIKRGARYSTNISDIEHVHFNSYFDHLIVDTRFNPTYTVSYPNLMRIYVGFVLLGLMLGLIYYKMYSTR